MSANDHTTERKCPSCGGSKVQTIRFQGDTFFQCVTPRLERGGTPCKFWSTKWHPKRVAE